MLGHHQGTMVEPRMMESYEDFLLARAGMLVLTRKELEGLPLWRYLHYLGFAEAERVLREREMNQGGKDPRQQLDEWGRQL